MTDVRIVTEPLGGSALSQKLQRGEAPAWLLPAPASASGWRDRAIARSKERDWESSWAALEPAMNATGEAARRLERVRRGGGVIVTTGQQPGLFGGPTYTWSKAMGALAFADALEVVTGLPVAAVFWAATDDADFAEAAYTITSRPGGAEKLRSENAPIAGTPMALAPLGDVSTLLARLNDACGSGIDDRALAIATRAYTRSEATVGSAYVELLRQMLEPLGMPVIDGAHPAVAGAGRETMRLALGRGLEIERALAARRTEIIADRLSPQVEDMPGLTLVFGRDGATKRRLTHLEAPAFAEGDSILTPNVLLRPIMEKAILPTVAYLGGPGEVSYFAQSSAVAAAMGIEPAVVVPRWSCTLIEPHVARLMERLKITATALAVPHELETRFATDAMSARSAAALTEMRRIVAALPAELAAEASPLGLDLAVQGATRSLAHRVDRLERRLVAGIKRREHALLADIGTLRGALFPLGTRQERALNLIPALTRNGLALLDEMRSAAAAHASSLIGPTG